MGLDICWICAWQLKRSLCDSISNPMLDTIYERAIAAGALGGKILGAGGGGYFLFYVPKAKQGAVTAALSELGLSRLKFRFEPKGSSVRTLRRIGSNQMPTPLATLKDTTKLEIDQFMIRP